MQENNNTNDFEETNDKKLDVNIPEYDDMDDFEVENEPSPAAAYPNAAADTSPAAPTDDEDGKDRLLEKEKRKAFLKKLKIPCITAVGVILCAFIVLFFIARSTITENGIIMKNVYIETLDVGGRTYNDTVSAINNAHLLQDTEFTLACDGKSYTIKCSDVGMAPIPEDTAKLAVNYCHSGNFILDGINAMGLIFSKHVILPSANVDTAILDEKINELGKIAVGELVQHYIELGDDGMVTLFSGKTGYNGDPSTAREAILKSIKNSDYSDIKVSFVTSPPEDITIDSFDAMVHKDPVEATFEVKDNQVSVVSADTGRYINREEAEPLIANFREGSAPVKVPFYVSQPTRTNEMLEGKLFSGTLASFSTYYGSSTSNRKANVARAASLINGKILGPGEVFSFNGTVGHRTTANGFYTAKEYLNGKSVDGIGGGTCQVSSTLYSAVLYADMSIVERLNHMMSVGYIPLGQDATVSDGGVDFKFKNSSEYPVKIVTSANGSTITVSIIGTPWEPKREVKISNSSSQSGKNTIVHSTRYVYSNGELISTDKLNSSTYMPHEPEKTPAPKPASAPASEPASPATEAPAEPENKPAEVPAEEVPSTAANPEVGDSSDSESLE